MKKFLTFIFISSLFLFSFANAENNFSKALRTCDKYSQLGGVDFKGNYYNILITLDKNKKNCVYKEKVYRQNDFQLLTCNFPQNDWVFIADSMNKFNEAYKTQIAKNKIYEAKLTNNAEILERYLINSKICKITTSNTNSKTK